MYVYSNWLNTEVRVLAAQIDWRFCYKSQIKGNGKQGKLMSTKTNNQSYPCGHVHNGQV